MWFLLIKAGKNLINPIISEDDRLFSFDNKTRSQILIFVYFS